MMEKTKDGVWTFTVYYKSDLRGYSCMNCSSPAESFIPNGDDLRITFWAKTGGAVIAVQMIGGFFRIPLPVSKVSKYFAQKPEFNFYPYFFSAKGDSTILEVESINDSIGKRRIVVYFPPGEKFVNYNNLYQINRRCNLVENVGRGILEVFNKL